MGVSVVGNVLSARSCSVARVVKVVNSVLVD